MTPEELNIMYEWMPQDARDAYRDAYIEYGADAAWAAVRKDARYAQWFPGNLTEDGRPRYAENQYAAVRQSYRDIITSVGLNPDIFEEQFTNLIIGEVAPNEFSSRVFAVYDRVASASEEIKARFSEANQTPITTEGILASALDPDIGTKILEGQIDYAEIAGAGDEFGFNLDMNAVDRLVETGMRLDEARGVFGQARQLVPILDTLAARHNDPEDEFDINDFLASDIYKDPRQSYRMRRLINAERAEFGVGGAVVGNAESLTGLRQA